jgi:heavy metal translocating P-type ATPase
LVIVPALGLAIGGGLWWTGRSDLAQLAWVAGIAPVLLILVATAVSSLWRGEVGLDIIAALAMGGALAGGENLAGVVVAMMFAGGQALESYAQGSADREMKALLGRVARTAQVRRADRLEMVPIEDIRPGDRLLIRTGEAIPVDGFVASAAAILDESALTGEAAPVRHETGSGVASGVTNAGAPFDLEATQTAANSTYAGIVNLVEAARASKAPMSRLADRYALGFLAATVALAGGAWLLSGDWRRALAVLVVATPCPLILAVPVAVVSGMSWCARRGVLIKSAKILETLALVKTLLIDKTGTLTYGRARLKIIESVDGIGDDEILRMAGSLAQASQHVMSEALVDAARSKGVALVAPAEVLETPGEGLAGLIGARRVVLGHPDFVARMASAPLAGSSAAITGSVSVAVGIDGVHAATLVFVDELRPETPAALRTFREQGIARIVLVTGDRAEVAEAVGRVLPIDRIIANASPADKVEAVRSESAAGPTIMIGDGINDAPALALADVGVALGARGAAAASEAADVVVLVDKLDRIAEAIGIARRTRAIALQSVIVGLGLSGLGMIAAAWGFLPPIAGALAQEAIDVAVVLNALRCLGETRWTLTSRQPPVRLGRSAP